MKKATVIRLGAWGDMVICSPVFRLLKEQGYHVSLNCRKATASVFDNNPNIDEFIFHDEGMPNGDALTRFWKSLEEKCDRFINLSGSIEEGLLPAEGKHVPYNWSHELRHAKFNVNYYDRTLELAGFPEVKGLNGEVYFSADELAWGQKLRDQYRNRFWVLWALSGSSFHKTYPWAEKVAKTFLDRHRGAMTMTVGDDLCRLLEWEHPQNKKRAHLWSTDFRKSMIACKFADMVVSAETGIANVAGCFDTPKAIMLSHSSVENLTKYWVNCKSLTPTNASCYPCHKLHYTLKSCPLDTLAEIPEKMRSVDQCLGGNVEAPICTSRMKPETVLAALEEAYDNWKHRRNHGWSHVGATAAEARPEESQPHAVL